MGSAGEPTNPAAQINFLLFLPNTIKIGFFFSSHLISTGLFNEGIILWLLTELLVIELLVVIVEYALLRLVFRSLHKAGKLDGPVTAGRTLKIAVLANLASLVLGLVAFWGRLIWQHFV